MVLLFVNSDNFYESLKKLRLEDNFIVKSIGATLLNRVSQPNMPVKAACSTDAVSLWVGSHFAQP